MAKSKVEVMVKNKADATDRNKVEVMVRSKDVVTDKDKVVGTVKSKAVVMDKDKVVVTVKNKVVVTVKSKDVVMEWTKAEANKDKAEDLLAITNTLTTKVGVVAKVAEVIADHTEANQAEVVPDRTADVVVLQMGTAAAAKAEAVLHHAVQMETQAAATPVMGHHHHAEAIQVVERPAVVSHQWIKMKYVALPLWEAEHHTEVDVHQAADAHPDLVRDHEAVHVLPGKINL